jgi:hypothetical protein
MTRDVANYFTKAGAATLALEEMNDKHLAAIMQL